MTRAPIDLNYRWIDFISRAKRITVILVAARPNVRTKKEKEETGAQANGWKNEFKCKRVACGHRVILYRWHCAMWFHYMNYTYGRCDLYTKCTHILCRDNGGNDVDGGVCVQCAYCTHSQFYRSFVSLNTQTHARTMLPYFSNLFLLFQSGDISFRFCLARLGVVGIWAAFVSIETKCCNAVQQNIKFTNAFVRKQQQHRQWS